MPAKKCFILCPTKATKPKGKPRAKASQSRTNARGRGGKPSSKPHFTAEDLVNLSKDDQKAKFQNIFRDEEIDNLFLPIPPSTEERLKERLSAILGLKINDFSKIVRQWVPGYTARSDVFLTRVDHLRKAVFPASVSITNEHSHLEI